MIEKEFFPGHLKQAAVENRSGERIPLRNITFDIHSAYESAWLDGDVIFSAIFDAFSLLLPDGERFFIKAVNQCLPSIEDPQLLADIRAFSAQEAYHTREHESYNRLLQQEGIPLESAYKQARALLSLAEGKMTRLCVTVAIEHLTACFSELVFNHGLLRNAKDAYRDLWTWHALEENEHRAVAFEVFQNASASWFPGKAYLFRCIILLVVTFLLGKLHYKLTVEILGYRGQTISLKTRLAVLRGMFGSRGTYRLALGSWLKFLVPGFSPADMAQPRNLPAWRDYFDEMAAKKHP